MAGITRYAWFAAMTCVFFLCGCGEGNDVIRKKLDIILEGDLKTIASDLPKSSLADSMYYTVVSYKTYSKGMYSKMAVVDFYFLKGVKAKITRKYRYYTSVRLWDRYYNVYAFFNDSTKTKSR